MSGPLSDIRVLDISTVLAGPNCARYFADFGADVIKVERPDTGDSLRGMAWRDPRDGSGLWWKLVNRNKRNIALRSIRCNGRFAFWRWTSCRCELADHHFPDDGPGYFAIQTFG